ncbi:hypothetical protein, partial [Alloalcanivorax gelatiniphagus]
ALAEPLMAAARAAFNAALHTNAAVGAAIIAATALLTAWRLRPRRDDQGTKRVEKASSGSSSR